MMGCCDLDLIEVDWGLDTDVLILYHTSANTTYFLFTLVAISSFLLWVDS